MTNSPIIKEDFIHFLWRTKKVPPRLFTTNNQEIEVLDFGTYNTNAGPDFFNAKIRIDETTWVGNIEMHVYSRDWVRHGHNHDRAYDNVILHVVYDHDGDIYILDRNIPTVALKGAIPRHYLDQYALIMGAKTTIPCQAHIGNVPSIKVDMLKHALMIERLETKSDSINKILHFTQENWDETLYILIARYIGSVVNADPFEQLARSLSLTTIYKNQHNPISIDALFFGQAGMLTANYKDDYFLILQKEYLFLQKKYDLKPLNPVVWKFGRLRPPNFPTIRIAQLSALMSNVSGVFSQVKEIENVSKIKDLFKSIPNEYWDYHYRFGIETEYHSKKMVEGFIDLLLINAVSPLLYLYGKKIDDITYVEKSLQIFDGIKPEANKIVNIWKSLGVSVKSAYDSQALIQLKKSYCDHFRCMNCKIGHEIMKNC